MRTAPNQAQESGAGVFWPSMMSHGDTRCFSCSRRPCFLSGPSNRSAWILLPC